MPYYNGMKHDQWQRGSIMVDLNLPKTMIGYASPICPHCDKEHGPEVAGAGPIQCDGCGTWFEVTARTIYQSEAKLDYKGNQAKTAK